jgi:hypothetical protein
MEAVPLNKRDTAKPRYILPGKDYPGVELLGNSFNKKKNMGKRKM